MEIFSIIISFMQFVFEIIVFLKLHWVYIPLILCEIINAGETTTEKVLAVSTMAWIVVVVKSVINHFKN